MMKTNMTRGFTIVELLTVMAVIAVLIGLLIPALGLVKDHAKEIQQRAQFHSLDVALEMFKSEFGAYPDSFDNFNIANTETSYENVYYCGAEKLAEALVGWDLLGVHPKSGFRSDGENYFAANTGYLPVYNTTAGAAGGLKVGAAPNWVYYEADGAANVKARKGPMIDLENANAFRMQDVYGTNTTSFNPNNIVLCDVFARKRTSAAKTGMPILYFKARTNFQFQDTTTVDAAGNNDDIYLYDDNAWLIALGTAEAVPQLHEFEVVGIQTNYEKFEQAILNTQVKEATMTTANPLGIKRPYRADSYIMISAGKDGNYGTADDLYNFQKGVSE